MKRLLLLIYSFLLILFWFAFIAPDVNAQACIADGNCIGPSETCCSGNYSFDATCSVTETRCGGGTCTCANGIPSGPFSCPVNVATNNCDAGFNPVCPESSDCTTVPSCTCESFSSLNCGEEQQECCPGNSCKSSSLQCVTLCGPQGCGGSRCLRPCGNNSDCGSTEICQNGGCVHNPTLPPPPEVKIKIFCTSNGQPTDDPGPSGRQRLYTAIGCIPIAGGDEFISFILGWGIGIAGGIAFLLIVVASFQIITSSGDPKKLQAGRELLTSAIAGLVLLIFSALILRLIGVELLGIPGFG